MIVATYNVHRCIGADGRHDPDRVAAVIRELDADVVGLQEVDAKPHIEAGLDQVVYLAEATGLTGIAGPTLTRHYGEYGNALLTRLPVRGATLLDLSVADREPRGAIDAEVDADGVRCRVLVTHLGFGAPSGTSSSRIIAAPPRAGPDRLTSVLHLRSERMAAPRSGFPTASSAGRPVLPSACADSPPRCHRGASGGACKACGRMPAAGARRVRSPTRVRGPAARRALIVTRRSGRSILRSDALVSWPGAMRRRGSRVRGAPASDWSAHAVGQQGIGDRVVRVAGFLDVQAVLVDGTADGAEAAELGAHVRIAANPQHVEVRLGYRAERRDALGRRPHGCRRASSRACGSARRSPRRTNRAPRRARRLRE